MDILIKSFNRPYYLDRCLFSINKHVKKNNGNIYILDDGTPQKYLDKIVLNYPNVIIKKSTQYDEKQSIIEQNKTLINYSIPINLWVEAAKNASEYFILLEDDIWFTDDFDCEDVLNELKNHNVVFSKLHWIGNDKINLSSDSKLTNHLVLIKPKLFTTIPIIYYLIFNFNKFKSRRILNLLNIYTMDRNLAYYSIYSVAGVIFKKDYFEKLWENHKNSINEDLQKYNALKIYSKEKDKINYSHFRNEILKTGFISSATNQNKEHYNGNVDMFKFNKILNEAWLNNNFDTIKSLPKDIDNETIINILKQDLNNEIAVENWLVWIENFKNQYRNIGCKVD